MSAKPPIAPRDEPAFNAGDPEQVREREKRSKLRDDIRKQGLQHVMADAKGRAWMRHLLVEKLFTRVGRSVPTGIFTGNSTTFYNVALREVGDRLAAELATICPEQFRLMENEGDS